MLRKGISIWRDEGLFALRRRTVAFAKWKLYRLKLRILRQAHWKIGVMRGYIQLSLCNTKAKFSVSDKENSFRTMKRFYLEKNELRNILQQLEAGDVFYDVGANTGLYTCFVSQANVSGEVVAFEPYSANVSGLKENMELNGDNISIIEKALADETGTQQLAVPSDPTPGHGTAALGKESESQEKVESVRGDELIESGEIPQPNIVKIDVEGAEYFVVEGLEDALKDEACRSVFCEVHLTQSPDRPSLRDHGLELADLICLLEGYGFEVERASDRLLVCERKDDTNPDDNDMTAA